MRRLVEEEDEKEGEKKKGGAVEERSRWKTHCILGDVKSGYHFL